MARSAHEIFIEAIGQDRDAARLIDRLAVKLKELPEEEEIRIEMDTVRATQQLKSFEQRMRELSDEIVTIGVDKIFAEQQMDEMERDLLFLTRSRDVDIRLRAESALAELSRLNAEVEAATAKDHHVEVKVDVDRSIFDRLRTLAPVGQQVTRAWRGAGSAFTATADAANKVSTNLGPFTVRGGVLVQLLGVLIPLVVSFGAVLVGLVGSLATAAAGLAALAVAAAAVVLPLALVGLGAVSAFKSMTESQEEAKKATEALRAARERYADAERNVQRATQEQTRAEGELVDARREAAQEARQELAEALGAVETAEQGLADAQRQSMFAQQALTQAREDAQRQLDDMRLAAEGAEIGEERAKNALEDARARLDELRRGGGSAEDIERARLDVRDAELGLEQAKLSSQRATEDLSEAERKGIERSDQVVAAKQRILDTERAVADAHAQLAEAQDRVTEAEAFSVRKAPEVVAARQAVQAANRRLADANWQLAEASREQADAQRESNRANAEAAKATPAFDRLVEAIRKVGEAFRRMLGPAVNRIFDGLARAIDSIIPLMRGLRSAFAELGRSMGNALARLGREFASPEWTAFFRRLIGASTTIMPKLTRLFIAWLRILRDIVDGAMPFLVAGLEAMTRAFEGLAGSGSNAQAIMAAVGGAIGHVETWFRLIGQVGRLLFGIFKAANPLIREMVDRLSDTVQATADWANSAEGQASIRQFFEDVIPLVESVAGFIGKLIGAFIKFGQLVAPPLAAIIDSLTPILDGITFLFDLLLKIPAPVRKFIGVFAAAFNVLGKFGLAGKLIRAVLGTVVSIVVNLSGKLGGLVKLIGGAAVSVFNALRRAAEAVWGAFRNGLAFIGRIPGRFVEVFGTVVRFLASLPGRMIRLGGKIIGGILDGFKKFAGSIPGWIKDQVGNALDFLGKLPGKLFELGKEAMRKLIDGIKWAAGKVEDAMRSVLPGFLEDKILGSKGGLDIEGTGAGKGAKALGEALGDALGDAIKGGGGRDKGGRDKGGRRRRRGPALPLAAEAAADGGSQVEQHFHVTVPGGGSPDALATATAISRLLRAQGAGLG